MENMKESYSMERDMEKGLFISFKEAYMKDHGLTIKCMDTANFFTPMAN
jgi:hypothetical protein